MGTNGFRDDELVSRRVRVGEAWETRRYQIVAGKLLLVHEENETLSLDAELTHWNGTYAVVKCTATTKKGSFAAYGTANSQRDSRLAESLVELAHTRSVARALRFAGYGVEYTSAEEVNHVVEQEMQREHVEESPSGSNGNGKPASPAQIRLLYALAKKAELTDEDKGLFLSPLGATTFNNLNCASASRLISYFKTQVSA